MTLIRYFVFLCLLGSASAEKTELSPETVRRYTQALLFYLGSPDTTIPKDTLNVYLAKEDDPIAMLYKKVYKNRMDLLKAREDATKQRQTEQKEVYYFKNWEIRQAVIDILINELGNGALEILLDSIHSSRQEIVLGVVKALDKFEDDRIVLIMSDVLELDKWGRSKFSSLVRRHAAHTLRKYLDQDMAKNLLSSAIVDLDPMVRKVAQSVVGQADEMYLKFSEDTYIKAYNFELDLVQSESALAKSKGALDEFNNNAYELSSMSLLLENIAMHVPSVLVKIHIPEELLTRRGLVRTFLVHHKVLPEELRLKILDHVLNNPGDNIVLLDALKAMKKEDGVRYKSQLGPCLDIKNSPAILSLALELCLEWGGGIYEKELQLIIKKAKLLEQEELLEKAEKALSTL